MFARLHYCAVALRLPGRVAFTAIALMACAAAAQADTWPIKEYVIEGSLLGEDLPQPVEDEITDWMRQVAFHLEGLGFLPPRHEAKTSDKKALVVYLDETLNQIAAAADDCHNPKAETSISINPLKILENGETRPQAYQDLAHEIFHTVQYAYPMFRDCDTGSFIREATAEAVGIETAHALDKADPYTSCQVGPRLYSKSLYIRDEIKNGMKTYGSSLRDPPCNTRRNYNTQSFWQFLGEWAQGMGKAPPGANAAALERRWGVGRPRPDKPVPPDYSYLDTLFSVPHGGDQSFATEMKWLNTGLRKHFGFDLQYGYSTFAGAWSAWNHANRMSRYPPDPPDGYRTELEKNWKKYAFGGCVKVAVPNSTTPIVLPPVEINRVAARCYQLDFGFSGTANFKVLGTGNEANLRALTFVLRDGSVSRRPSSVKHLVNNAYAATWPFTLVVTAGQPEYMIMTNVDADPGRSTRQTPRLRIQLATASSSKVAPRKTNPSGLPGQNTAPPGSPASQKAMVTDGLETQSWKVSVSQHRRDACEGAFIDRVCGPMTRIGISLVPDAALFLEDISQPGVGLEQVSAVLGGVQDHGGNEFVHDLATAFDEISRTEGGHIEIALPLIEFGDTGTFDNALISVSKATDSSGGGGGSFVTVGPARVGGCPPDGYFPFSGSVTIEEASEEILRGHYTARLVDRDQSKTEPCLDTYDVYETVTGSFSLANPPLGEHDKPPPAADTADHLINEVSKMFPGLITPEMQATIRARAAEADASDANEDAGAAGEAVAILSPAECDCTCMKSFEIVQSNPECFDPCESQFRQCPHFDALVGLYEHSRPVTDDEAAHISVMREQLLQMLAGEPNAEIREVALSTFDSAPSFQMKENIFKMYRSHYTQ